MGTKGGVHFCNVFFFFLLTAFLCADLSLTSEISDSLNRSHEGEFSLILSSIFNLCNKRVSETTNDLDLVCLQSEETPLLFSAFPSF